MNCSIVARTILTATILFGSTSGVRAECIRLWKNAADAERRSTMVFSGTVIGIKADPDGMFATFEVQRVWKGMSYLIFADQLPADDPRASRGPT